MKRALRFRQTSGEETRDDPGNTISPSFLGTRPATFLGAARGRAFAHSGASAADALARCCFSTEGTGVPLAAVVAVEWGNAIVRDAA